LVLDQEAGGAAETGDTRCGHRILDASLLQWRHIGKRLDEQSQHRTFRRVDLLLTRTVIVTQRNRGRPVAVENDQTSGERAAPLGVENLARALF